MIRCITVNGERFAGLNFRGFEEYRKNFSVNIRKLRIMALFKCFKRKVQRKFSRENFIEWNPRKFSPANLSPFTVYGMVTT